MRIAIFIDNEGIADVDCQNLEFGNPGIGGTEYCVLLLAEQYKRFYPDDQIFLLAVCPGKLPEVDGTVFVDSPMDVAGAFKKIGADMLVISSVYHGEPIQRDFFDMIVKNKIKTIFWGHNFYLSDFCNYIAECEYARANVFVGRQQYDRYLDHKVIKKSTFIYNMYPNPPYESREKISNHTVTYIGSLVPTKGFHVLAHAWKEILKQVPDAELNVIGSGKLYGRSSKLGQYGIAEESYEQQFIDGVTDPDGAILPSVHFLGVLGAEKGAIIRDTCVGVVNPTGRTETFGISALDFESLGVPVVTIEKGGFLDTVIDKKTGLLYGTTDQLAEKVIMLLKDYVANETYGKNGIALSKSFAPEHAIGQWNELFRNVYLNQLPSFINPSNFMNTNLKNIRWRNRKLKNKLHWEYPFSVIGLETFARKVLRRLGK